MAGANGGLSSRIVLPGCDSGASTSTPGDDGVTLGRNQGTVSERPTEVPRGVSDLAALRLYRPPLDVERKSLENLPAAAPNDKVAEPGFGSLKTVLSVVYTNYKVCLHFFVSIFSLKNPSTGNRRHQNQGRRSPLPDKHIGRTP